MPEPTHSARVEHAVTIASEARRAARESLAKADTALVRVDAIDGKLDTLLPAEMSRKDRERKLDDNAVKRWGIIAGVAIALIGGATTIPGTIVQANATSAAREQSRESTRQTLANQRDEQEATARRVTESVLKAADERREAAIVAEARRIARADAAASMRVSGSGSRNWVDKSKQSNVIASIQARWASIGSLALALIGAVIKILT